MALPNHLSERELQLSEISQQRRPLIRERELQLSEISQQRRPLIRSNETAINDKAVRRKNRRQVGWRIQPSHACEEGNVVVNHLFECGRRVVVKVGRSSAYSTQLCDVHHPEVRRLAREKQSSWIRSGDELEGAIRESDSVRARVTRQPLRTWRVTIRGWSRTCGLDVGHAVWML